MSPTETEGPYYVDGAMMRRDIREDRPGSKLRLRARIVDVSAECKAIVGVPFEIWQADRDGQYSSFMGGKDSRWLRGVQMTDEGGVAEFDTNYPGSYPGRCIHIHFKVHLPGNKIVTSQMYFDEKLSAEVMASADYKGHGSAITQNATDGVARNDYKNLMLACQTTADGYVGDITIGVRMS